MHKFTSHEKVICYETYGDVSNPALVLICGLGGQLIAWPETFLQFLVEHGFYVIVFDNRDSGLSHSYDDLPTPSILEMLTAKNKGILIKPPYTLEDMAHDVSLLLDELSIAKAHIAGMSMGGMIAQVFAIEYLKRTLSLSCLATTSGDPTLPPARPDVLKFFTSPKRQGESIESFIRNKLDAYRLYNHPDYFDEEKARAYCLKSYERAYNPKGYTRQLYAVAFAKPRNEKLRQLHLPSLILHGTCDPVFSIEHAQHLASLLPNNQLVVIDKMGHGLLEPFCEQVALELANLLLGM